MNQKSDLPHFQQLRKVSALFQVNAEPCPSRSISRQPLMVKPAKSQYCPQQRQTRTANKYIGLTCYFRGQISHAPHFVAHRLLFRLHVNVRSILIRRSPIIWGKCFSLLFPSSPLVSRDAGLLTTIYWLQANSKPHQLLQLTIAWSCRAVCEISRGKLSKVWHFLIHAALHNLIRFSSTNNQIVVWNISFVTSQTGRAVSERKDLLPSLKFSQVINSKFILLLNCTKIVNSENVLK